MVLMVYTIYSRFTGGTPDGYATIVVVICFMFSLLFLLFGVMGEDIGIIFQEIKIVHCILLNVPETYRMK
jgi:hypothetical protein